MRKHNEIVQTRADEKVLKALGKDVAEELDTYGESELKTVIVNSLESMSEAVEKLSSNPVYQDLRRRLDDVTAGKKDVDKYQGAKIKYARQRLRAMGKLGSFDKNELETALLTAKRALREKRAEIASKAKEVAKPRCKECGQEKRVVGTESVTVIEGKVESTTPKFECYRCETLPAYHAGLAAKEMEQKAS